MAKRLASSSLHDYELTRRLWLLVAQHTVRDCHNLQLIFDSIVTHVHLFSFNRASFSSGGDRYGPEARPRYFRRVPLHFQSKCCSFDLFLFFQARPETRL